VLAKTAAGDGNVGGIATLCALVQSRGAAFLIANDTATATAIGADGVHLDDPGAYREARRVLGPDRIIGVACGRSRHDAMEAGDAGADYVAFTAAGPDDLEIITDWSAMTVVPCVVMGGVRTNSAPAIVEAGADFLAIEADWTDPAPAKAALAVYQRIITDTTRTG
jgi:thiamine-phosphate pyrophosphorylase